VVGTVPMEANVNTEGVVTLVFVIVRSLLVVPLFEPSTITLLLNIFINAPVTLPVKVAVTPEPGLIVSV
jgi:hypothetical protein